MRYMGIDYGTKRVGIALSDENGGFAFPKDVFENNDGLLARVTEFARVNGVGAIVIGESKNFKGESNPVMARIREFKDGLSKSSGLPVEYEPEYLTSLEASRTDERREGRDAQAAALILQSYLDHTKSSILAK